MENKKRYAKGSRGGWMVCKNDKFHDCEEILRADDVFHDTITMLATDLVAAEV